MIIPEIYFKIFTFILIDGAPGGSVVKNPPANSGDMDSIPGLGTSSVVGNGNQLQFPCLGNPTDRGARWAAAH